MWFCFLSLMSSSHAAAAAKLLQSCLTLCDPIDGSPPGSPTPGILQARTLEGLPFPSPMHTSQSESEVAQSCPTHIRVKLYSQNTDFFCSSILDSLKLCGTFVVSCSFLA